MAVLLYHEKKNDGQIAISEGKIAGESTPARRYHHKGHFVEVDGPSHVLHHDIEELQKLGYRLATVSEQQDFTNPQRKAGKLLEGSNNKGDK